MATLSRQTIATTGTVLTYASAAGGGDVCTNIDGKTMLHVKNGSGGDITVTITQQVASLEVPLYGTMLAPAYAVVVAAGAEKFIGPFPINTHNNSSGQIAITYSGVTSLTIAGFVIPKEKI